MRILKEESCLLIIDFQEKLVPHMLDIKDIIDRTCLLIQGAQILQVPRIITQQYTKGLGLTIDPIKELCSPFDAMEKTAFSCWDDSNICHKIKALGKRNIIIAGIEAHVCVLQTVLDLIENGLNPVVVVDCISSRKNSDKQVSIQRMQQAGAILTTYESILFELTRYAGNEPFKAISKLVK